MKRYYSITARYNFLSEELTRLSREGWTLVGQPIQIATLPGAQLPEPRLYALLEREDDDD